MDNAERLKVLERSHEQLLGVSALMLRSISAIRNSLPIDSKVDELISETLNKFIELLDENDTGAEK